MVKWIVIGGGTSLAVTAAEPAAGLMTLTGVADRTYLLTQHYARRKDPSPFIEEWAPLLNT